MYSPTVREIGKGVGLKSTSSVSAQINYREHLIRMIVATRTVFIDMVLTMLTALATVVNAKDIVSSTRDAGER